MTKHRIFLLLFILLNSKQVYSQYVPYRKGDLWGYADQLTSIPVSEIKYDSVYINRFGGLLFTIKNGKQGLLKPNSDQNKLSEILLPDFDYITKVPNHDRNSKEWFFIISKNRKYGIYSSSGKFIVPLIYASIEVFDFEKPYYLLKKEGDYNGAIYNLANDSLLTSFSYKLIETRNTKKNHKFSYEVINAKNEVFYLDDYDRLKKMDIGKENIILESQPMVAVPNDYSDFLKNEVLGNYYKVSKLKGQQFKNVYSTNSFVDNYLIILHKRRNTLGLIDTITNKVIAQPVYAGIEYQKLGDNILFILKSRSKIDFLFKDSIIHSGIYDSAEVDKRNCIIQTHSNNLNGYIFLPRYYKGKLYDNTFFVFSPKFMNLNYIDYYSKVIDFARVCFVRDYENKSYFISSNGKIYYEK
jgi:hypothetical protein